MIYFSFNSPEHLKRFQSYLNCCHVNISFTTNNEKDIRKYFLGVNIIHETRKIYSLCLLQTFSGIYTHVDSFLQFTYKIGITHTLLYILCSDWTKFHLELVQLMDVFKSTSYTENIINNCFKVFLNNKHRIEEKVITVLKKPMFFVLPYLVSL